MLHSTFEAALERFPFTFGRKKLKPFLMLSQEIVSEEKEKSGAGS